MMTDPNRDDLSAYDPDAFPEWKRPEWVENIIDTADARRDER